MHVALFRLNMREDFYNFVMKAARLTSVSSDSSSDRGWMSTSMMRFVYRCTTPYTLDCALH